MPKKNIYVSDADMPLVEQAEKKFAESLSAVFVDCLRKRLEESEIKPEEMEKIVLEFWDSNDNPTIKKSFRGRWLLNDVEPESRPGGVQWDHSELYSVALTSKGNLVMYTVDSRDRRGPAVETYVSLDHLLSDTNNVPENVMVMVAGELGRDFEIELDV